MTEEGANTTFTAALISDGRADNQLEQKKPSQLHSLPFSMDFNGPALVSKFFQTEDGANGLKAALFRGHLLLGKTVRAPEGFAFYAVKESEHSQSEEGEMRTYNVVDSVPSMDVWEYDEPPESRKKCLQNALVALQIANDLAN
ncbi:hypothetical protein niasHS_007277 [Heterodera schachtii]|uniref:Uncharacterized protein n=1 Tax=Heterodera schachtii TaxID=97005 RepID=A0ABD2JJV8_HETSC